MSISSLPLNLLPSRNFDLAPDIKNAINKCPKIHECFRRLAYENSKVLTVKNIATIREKVVALRPILTAHRESIDWGIEWLNKAEELVKKKEESRTGFDDDDEEFFRDFYENMPDYQSGSSIFIDPNFITPNAHLYCIDIPLSYRSYDSCSRAIETGISEQEVNLLFIEMLNEITWLAQTHLPYSSSQLLKKKKQKEIEKLFTRFVEKYQPKINFKDPLGHFVFINFLNKINEEGDTSISVFTKFFEILVKAKDYESNISNFDESVIDSSENPLFQFIRSTAPPWAEFAKILGLLGLQVPRLVEVVHGVVPPWYLAHFAASKAYVARQKVITSTKTHQTALQLLLKEALPKLSLDVVGLVFSFTPLTHKEIYELSKETLNKSDENPVPSS